MGGRREVQEGGDICVPMGDSETKQYCKAIILQLKINLKKKMKLLSELSWDHESTGLRLCASNAKGMDSIPPRGTKIPHV